MPLAFALFFALRLGTSVTNPGLPGAASGLRQAVREVAQASEGLRERGAPLSRAAWSSTGGRGERPSIFERAYDPEEWLSAVAGQLHLRDVPVVRAARWLSSMPVGLDVGPERVVVSVHVSGF